MTTVIRALMFGALIAASATGCLEETDAIGEIESEQLNARDACMADCGRNYAICWRGARTNADKAKCSADLHNCGAVCETEHPEYIP